MQKMSSDKVSFPIKKSEKTAEDAQLDKGKGKLHFKVRSSAPKAEEDEAGAEKQGRPVREVRLMKAKMENETEEKGHVLRKRKSVSVVKKEDTEMQQGRRAGKTNKTEEDLQALFELAYEHRASILEDGIDTKTRRLAWHAIGMKLLEQKRNFSINAKMTPAEVDLKLRRDCFDKKYQRLIDKIVHKAYKPVKEWEKTGQKKYLWMNALNEQTLSDKDNEEEEDEDAEDEEYEDEDAEDEEYENEEASLDNEVEDEEPPIYHHLSEDDLTLGDNQIEEEIFHDLKHPVDLDMKIHQRTVEPQSSSDILCAPLTANPCCFNEQMLLRQIQKLEVDIYTEKTKTILQQARNFDLATNIGLPYQFYSMDKKTGLYTILNENQTAQEYHMAKNEEPGVSQSPVNNEEDKAAEEMLPETTESGNVENSADN